MTSMEIAGKNKASRHVECLPINKLPVLYSIFLDEDETVVAGYALITGDVIQKPLHFGKYKTALIWHLYVEPQNRRKGYAKYLIAALKATYDEIWTQVLSGEEVAKLLFGCGFVPEKKGEQDFVVWYKEKK
jgi:GNAT superfamily N-acetyltransferase